MMWWFIRKNLNRLFCPKHVKCVPLSSFIIRQIFFMAVLKAKNGVVCSSFFLLHSYTWSHLLSVCFSSFPISDLFLRVYKYGDFRLIFCLVCCLPIKSHNSPFFCGWECRLDILKICWFCNISYSLVKFFRSMEACLGVSIRSKHDPSL